MRKPPTNSESSPAIPWQDCLAKTYTTADGQKLAGRSVLNHCQIVGTVAREILERMPEKLRKGLYPAGSELAAAAHDIGKISPTFQEKIFRGTDGYTNNSKPELKGVDPALEKIWGGHAGVSQAAARALSVGKFIPEILGQHHGYSPQLNGKSAHAEQFGGEAWQAQRNNLVSKLKLELNSEWPVIADVIQARAIAGLTSVADWIGSGPYFENPQDDWLLNIATALDNAGFIAPELRANLSFADIFGFPAREIQNKLFTVAQQPGVYILEAPMGIGKTEAALYAAYQTMNSGNASGIYFALPTQLTSDKIHERMNAFLEKILIADSRNSRALLLHGNAWLKEMGEEGQPGGAWFNQGKRGILAPFAVGTIDQALMAVMNVKHGFVRAFGLAGKVVILDEVHSYDMYTGTILDELVKTLLQLQCTVIILSATLTKYRRQQLLGQESNSESYPLISVVTKEQLAEIEIKPEINHAVSVSLHDKDAEAIEEALLRAEQGQQVLWIENTVAEAQELYALLASRAAEMEIDCGLLHSRFLKADREVNEEKWVTLFGKDGVDQRGMHGRILVGTQVLEQSLDIDADYLVSRFCPTDMLLQRLGRLWRHATTKRPAGSQCEAWLLAPALDNAITNPEQEFGKSAFVYSPYLLCRSLEVFQRIEKIVLPDDIRPLIEKTYEIREEKDAMEKWQYELENGHNRGRGRKGSKALRMFGLRAVSSGVQTESDDKAQTRFSEQDSAPCLLLRAIRDSSDKKCPTVITLLSGEEIVLPKKHKSLDKRAWRDIAAMIMKNTVNVAPYLAPDLLPVKTLDWLEDYAYVNNKYDQDDNKKSKLHIALVSESGEVRAINGGVASQKYTLQYCCRLGYQSKKAAQGN